MAITYDPRLDAARMDLHVRNASKSGGMSSTGRSQNVISDAGYWAMTVAGIAVYSEELAWAYDAMIARLRMGEEMVVGLPLPYRPEFENVIVAGGAALRATSVQLAGHGTDLIAGQKFSIGNRLYQITQVVSELTENNGLVVAISGSENWDDSDVWFDEMLFTSDVKIWPPLRASVSGGAAVSFTNLRITVKLVDMSSGDLALDIGRNGTADLSLVEFI